MAARAGAGAGAAWGAGAGAGADSGPGRTRAPGRTRDRSGLRSRDLLDDRCGLVGGGRRREGHGAEYRGTDHGRGHREAAKRADAAGHRGSPGGPGPVGPGDRNDDEGAYRRPPSRKPQGIRKIRDLTGPEKVRKARAWPRRAAIGPVGLGPLVGADDDERGPPRVSASRSSPGEVAAEPASPATRDRDEVPPVGGAEHPAVVAGVRVLPRFELGEDPPPSLSGTTIVRSGTRLALTDKQPGEVVQEGQVAEQGERRSRRPWRPAPRRPRSRSCRRCPPPRGWPAR